MGSRVCYLGDDDFSGAALYLAGIMTHYGVSYDHIPSPASPPDTFATTPYHLYVVSDYPAARFRPGQLEHVAQRVREGAGLLMFGGWESFYGRLGEYPGTPLAEVLPVTMAAEDDRRNFAQPCLVEQVVEHAVVDGLPWQTPPGIGGLNAFTPKPQTTTVLEAVPFQVVRGSQGYQFTAKAALPLLVLGQYGAGRTAALATDVAPHWVGGWVDWGDRRLVQDAEGSFIDVGNWYAQFFRNLLVWTGRLGEAGFRV